MLPVARAGVPARLPPANRLSGLFDRLFGEDEVLMPMRPLSLPLSMWEDDAKVHLEVDAPGMTEKDIEVTVHEGDLVIRGERKVEKKENGFDSRWFGRFEERIHLPAGVEPAKVEATLVGGVLKIVLPKAPEAMPLKVAIKAE